MSRDPQTIYNNSIQHPHAGPHVASNPPEFSGAHVLSMQNLIEHRNSDTSRRNVSGIQTALYNERQHDPDVPGPDHARNPFGDLRSVSGSGLSETTWTWPSRRDSDKHHAGSDHAGQSPPYIANKNIGDSANWFLRKKAPRVSVACKACRVLKSKCDEKPRCESCTSKNIECKRDMPLKVENPQVEILNRLNHLMESHEVLKNTLIRTFPALEKNISQEKNSFDGTSEVQHDKTSSSSLAGGSSESFATSPLKSVIPSDHTTAWAKTLQWPAVADIIRELFDRADVIFDPMEQELKQSLLLTEWEGRNFDEDGIRKRVGFVPDWSRSGPILSPSCSSNSSELPETYSQQDSTPKDGLELRLDKITVYRLEEVYLNTLGAMHPIFDPRRIKNLVGGFVSMLPAINNFLSDDSAEPEARISESSNHRKRKQPGSTLGWRPQASINIATILLVLALGAICESRGCVRSNPNSKTPNSSRGTPILNKEQHSQVELSPFVRYSSLSPSNTSARFEDLARKEHEINSIAPSTVEGTPGINFFAAAMRIIGVSQTGGNTLEHVQASLLAGLYCGQLGRVLESHAHYSNASRALYMILNPRRAYLEKLAAKRKQLSADDNQLVIIFWTCLQLESDILAELDVPQSPILAWESTMPWPDIEMTTKSGLAMEVVECYVALLWLRKRLNQIHNELYGPLVQEEYSLSSMNHLQRLPFIDSLRDSLEGSNVIAPSWTWTPSDPPSTNILAARLRAKYYGGLVIVHRPFLRMVLNNGRPGSTDNIEVSEISPLIMGYAAKCVDALIKSTQAFQNVDGWRFIVTNPWGTAYAQWGNMLVLLAVYQHPTLRRHVTNELLQDLAGRTLFFVETLARSAPTLRSMHKILDFAVTKVLGKRGMGVSDLR